MPHQEHRHVRVLLLHMPDPPLNVAELRARRRAPVRAPRALVRLVERSAPEPALVVREHRHAARCVLPVRPHVPPCVLREAVHEHQDRAGRARGGGVRPGVELGAVGPREPRFGEDWRGGCRCWRDGGFGGGVGGSVGGSVGSGHRVESVD